MDDQLITDEMTVFDVVEQVPGALELFRLHGVNPAGECGPLTRQILLGDTPERCRLSDLDGLIIELKASTRAGQVRGEYLFG